MEAMGGREGVSKGGFRKSIFFRVMQNEISIFDGYTWYGHNAQWGMILLLSPGAKRCRGSNYSIVVRFGGTAAHLHTWFHNGPTLVVSDGEKEIS